MKKIGMIGVGNMGGAILRGMIASGYVAAEDVMACLHSEEKRQALAAEIPGLTCHDGCQDAGARVSHDCAGCKAAGTGRNAGRNQGGNQ